MPHHPITAAMTAPISSADRVQRIDTWITGRLEELRAVDQRVGERIAAMHKLETSLGRLSQKLHDQIQSIHPSSALFDQFTHQLEREASRIIDAARERLQVIEQPARDMVLSIKDDLQSLLEQAQTHLQPIQQRVHDLRQMESQLTDRAESVLQKVADAQTSLDADFQQRAERWVEHAQQLAQPIEQNLRDIASQQAAAGERATRLLQTQHDAFAQLEQHIHERVANMQRQLEAIMQEGLEHWVERAQQLAQPVHAELRALIARHNEATEQTSALVREQREHLEDLEERLQERLAAASAQMAEALAQRVAEWRDHARQITETHLQQRVQSVIEQSLSRARQSLDPQLRQASDQIAQQSNRAVQSVEQMMLKQVADARQQTVAAMSPLIDHFHQRLAGVNEQVRDTLRQAEERLRDQLASLRRGAMVAVDAIEQQVERRLDSLQPHAHAELEKTESLLRQRLAQMAQHSKELVQVTESQVRKQLREFDPLVKTVVRAAENHPAHPPAKPQSDAA